MFYMVTYRKRKQLEELSEGFRLMLRHIVSIPEIPTREKTQIIL